MHFKVLCEYNVNCVAYLAQQLGAHVKTIVHLCVCVLNLSWTDTNSAKPALFSCSFLGGFQAIPRSTYLSPNGL